LKQFKRFVQVIVFSFQAQPGLGAGNIQHLQLQVLGVENGSGTSLAGKKKKEKRKKN